MFASKYLITFLNEKWEVLKEAKLKVIPRTNEFIYLDDKYFRIICVVHQIAKKHNIIVMVKEFSFELIEKS